MFCKDCKQDKPVSDFHPKKESRTGYMTWCKVCHCNRCKANHRTRKVTEREREREAMIVREEVMAVDLSVWRQRLKVIAGLGIDIDRMEAGEVDNILRMQL